jgi:hypothetical protein
MFELYDLGITISTLFLFTIYLISIFIVGYTSITNYFFKCTNSVFFPDIISHIIFDTWKDCLNRKPMEVLLGMILLFLSIVPLSLVWPISYPVMWFFIEKYKNSHRFNELSNSV